MLFVRCNRKFFAIVAPGDADALVKDDADVENKESEQYRVPYYLENFKLIVTEILEDSYYENLFENEDLQTVTTFNNLSGTVSARNLFALQLVSWLLVWPFAGYGIVQSL